MKRAPKNETGIMTRPGADVPGAHGRTGGTCAPAHITLMTRVAHARHEALHMTHCTIVAYCIHRGLVRTVHPSVRQFTHACS